MKKFNIKINGISEDELFKLDSKNNRDNGYYSWVILRDLFLEHGYEMHTSDVNQDCIIDFELHVDVQNVESHIPYYLYMLESSQVWPPNGVAANLSKYRKVFTWDDLLVDGKRFVKANFPNLINIHPVDGFLLRDRFCCLIAGNKILDLHDERILYSERINTIRWFEKHAPQDFDLYGVGWDVPTLKLDFFGKVARRFWAVISKLNFYRPYPSYRGRLQHKAIALKRTRFSICYENICDIPGYITEKIFDCFFSGCVPVYWGANNIRDYIPGDCFIDRRLFPDTQALYEHLKQMPEDEFCAYQRRIAEFLQSEAASQFGAQFLAKTIVNTIVDDIGS